MKYALLTGCYGGMGEASLKKLIDEGYFVYGLDINKSNYQNDHFKFYQVDLRNNKEIEKVYESILEDNIQLSAIIHMSGIYDLNSLIEISEEDFIKIFDVNVFAIYRINKLFVNLLEKKGKIIMVSSELAPLDPLPFTGLYAISKATIEKYAYSLRMELQLLDYYVTVIRPGAIDTKLLDVSTNSIEEFTKNTAKYEHNAKKFMDITNKVESRKIPPKKIATLTYKILKKKKPRYIYKINRNPLLLILNILPQHLQNYIIKKILLSK